MMVKVDSAELSYVWIGAGGGVALLVLLGLAQYFAPDGNPADVMAAKVEAIHILGVLLGFLLGHHLRRRESRSEVCWICGIGILVVAGLTLWLFWDAYNAGDFSKVWSGVKGGLRAASPVVSALVGHHAGSRSMPPHEGQEPVRHPA